MAAQASAPGSQCIVSKRKEITGTLQVWELKKMLIKCQGWSLTHLNLCFYSGVFLLLLPKPGLCSPGPNVQAHHRSSVGAEWGLAGPGRGWLASRNPNPILRSHRDLEAEENHQAAKSSSLRPQQSKEGARGEGPFVGVGVGGTCLKFRVKKGICRQMAQGPSPHTALCTIFCILVPHQGPPERALALWRFC